MENYFSTADLINIAETGIGESSFKMLHSKGLEDFKKIGIPGKKSELYKYTFLEPLFLKKYKVLQEPDNYQFEIGQIFTCDVPQINTDVVLLVNGFYYKKNHIHGSLPNNIWIGSLKQAVIERPDIVMKYLGKISDSEDGLTALNAALFRDGIFIHVPKNTVLEKPLQVINVLLSEENSMVYQRNLIVLEENSSANIVICDHALTPHEYFTNSLTEVYVSENAHFDQTIMQNEHDFSARISSQFIMQERNSYVANNTITLHGGLIRNNTKITLNGEGAENSISGLFLTDKAQHVDNYVFINHAKPNCLSNQLFKGVLDDVSTGSFNGRILVSRDAQKTLAYQKNSNLLLKNTAKMNTRPQLEIYADDVKCSHGATVGQLDQEALFYMQARGIGKEEARLLLMFAFAHEIIELIKVPALKERIDELVNKRLRGELSRCQNCSIHCC